MPIFSKLIFYAVRWSARHGLHSNDAPTIGASPQEKLEKNRKSPPHRHAR